MRFFVSSNDEAGDERGIFGGPSGAGDRCGRGGRIGARCGARLFASIPHGHWRTTTFVAGLRLAGMDAPMVRDGPMNAEAFIAHVRHVLVPALRPGDVVVMDKLGCHTGAAVRQAIEAAGAELRVLPPSSPDFNPIAHAFAKLKALLRKTAARTRDRLWQAVGCLLDAFTAQECASSFTAAGHQPE